MSKHTAPENLTTRLLEHAAVASTILEGNNLMPGSGRHRAETVQVAA